VAPMPAAAAPQLNITTPPAEPFVPNAPATASISKQTGTVSVFATEREQKLVAKFLNEFRKRVTTQVLIETKVLQVELNDEFATGIDWKAFNLTGLANVSQSFTLPGLSSPASGAFALAFNPSNDFGAVISAISRFGTVRALSSPRVTVMNNQPAVVNVARDNVYFNFTATVTPATSTSNASTSVTGTQKNAPEGVILTVVPNANPDTGEIGMVVRPTVSKVVGHVTDPTISLTLAVNNITLPSGFTLPDNQIPELSVQEIDSILHMQSGQMMALGGLMKDENITTQDGVPLAKDIPVVGYLFKSHSDRIVKSELVLLIKATIVTGSNVDEMERKTYQVFGLDRHPSNL
jgi:MSHA biogenesis protein MshL